MIALLASFLISTNAPARELVTACRTMIPANVELRGRLILRNRKGIPQAEHNYVLSRSNAVTRLVVDGQPFPSASTSTFDSSVLGTDVTWSDLTLDYLWWDDVSFDVVREGESVHGQTCAVVVMKKGERTVRVWVVTATAMPRKTMSSRLGAFLRVRSSTIMTQRGTRIAAGSSASAATTGAPTAIAWVPWAISRARTIPTTAA